MTVNFIEVGRSKKNWSAECEKLEHNWLYNQVKKNGLVMSNDIYFEEVGIGIGRIYAGFRPIGLFTFGEQEVDDDGIYRA